VELLGDGDEVAQLAMLDLRQGKADRGVLGAPQRPGGLTLYPSSSYLQSGDLRLSPT
jgi:hypothetical protein